MNQYVSLICSIASALAAIAAVIVAIIVGTKQTRQEKKALDISLFEKRYDIYCDFLRIFQFAQYVQKDNDYTLSPHKQSNSLYIADQIIKEYRLMERGSFGYDIIRLQETISNSGGAEELRALNEESDLKEAAKEKLLSLKQSLITKAKIAEFCFDKTISDNMNNYIDNLFEYALLFDSKDPRIFEQLIASIKEIEKEQTASRMHDMVNLVK